VSVMVTLPCALQLHLARKQVPARVSPSLACPSDLRGCCQVGLLDTQLHMLCPATTADLLGLAAAQHVCGRMLLSTMPVDMGMVLWLSPGAALRPWPHSIQSLTAVDVLVQCQAPVEEVPGSSLRCCSSMRRPRLVVPAAPAPT